MVVREREGRKVCCARVQGNEWKRVTEKERERERETKDEVRARVVFERDTIASHREETVAGLPQGCLHRRGESYTKRGPHPIFHSSSCFVSFFFLLVLLLYDVSFHAI